jgi:hypothetical protein
MFTGKNIEPEIYDIFANYEHTNLQLALKKFREDQVSYLVLDSELQRLYSKRQSHYFKNEIGSNEINSINRLFKNINDLDYFMINNIINCNIRYCIYTI